jgi:hypothetical protein
MITRKGKERRWKTKRINDTFKRQKSSPLYATRDYCSLSLCLSLKGCIKKRFQLLVLIDKWLYILLALYAGMARMMSWSLIKKGEQLWAETECWRTTVIRLRNCDPLSPNTIFYITLGLPFPYQSFVTTIVHSIDYPCPLNDVNFKNKHKIK